MMTVIGMPSSHSNGGIVFLLIIKSANETIPADLKCAQREIQPGPWVAPPADTRPTERALRDYGRKHATRGAQNDTASY
ncbi:MAG: hypothetical protein ACREX9_15525 [Gammaproteobacteria bacterium]